MHNLERSLAHDSNSSDLEPMAPDDRVLVTLSFTLARRESALLGIRVRGALRAKRQKDTFGTCLD